MATHLGRSPLGVAKPPASRNSETKPKNEAADRALQYGTVEYFRRRYGLDPAPPTPVSEWEASPAETEDNPVIPPKKEIVLPEALDIMEGQE